MYCVRDHINSLSLSLLYVVWDNMGSSVPGWMDPTLIDAMKASDADVGQHSQWWRGMNNGMSKCWLMQDGCDTQNTRYSAVDGAPWSFVYECKESSLPQEALDAVFLFSPHSMLNLRGAVVPTRTLVPRIESNERKWKIVGMWRKRAITASSNINPRNSTNNVLPHNNSSPGDEDESSSFMNRLRNMPGNISGGNSSGVVGGGSNNGSNGDNRSGARQGAPGSSGGRGISGGGIHDLDLDAGMPALEGNAEGMDLENIPPVRIETWMVKVFHYGQDSDVTQDRTVYRKMFCILTVTPARNLNLAEYLRHSIVENTQGSMFPGMSQQASENMRKDKKDMLHRLLLGQMELCGFFANNSNNTSMRGGVPDPLDALNMPSTDYYPANYLSVPMAYRRIQYSMRKQGYDHRRIYVEGFSDTVSMFTVTDLQRVKEYNNSWAPSFYSSVIDFEALKPEERADFRARLHDECPPSWVREGEGNSSNRDSLSGGGSRGHQSSRRRRSRGRGGVQRLSSSNMDDEDDSNDDDDDVEDEDDDDYGMDNTDDLGGGGGGGDSMYVQRNRMPPIKVCLWYNPLMYISPSATRSEWEQQLGGFPAFFIYTMSRSIYSSATNPLLKPEYFMPEAKPMTTHARWHEHMDDGDNPFAGYCVAGWACRQFKRVMDACRQSIHVSEVAKTQMVMDYMQTCFNMHLGLIDTKSLRSKTVYWGHRLMREVNETVHHDLVEFLKDEMRLGTDTLLMPGSRTMSGKLLADGGYAQVSYLHCESLSVLNRDFFHLNDLNLSLLWRMLATTTHHCVGMNNHDLSAMGSSIVACR